MNKAEEIYSASEAATLALVWGTKYFRCYLYGKQFSSDRPFGVILRKFAADNSRLMRWSLRLSEFYFIIEHRAGSQIGHVNVLSRHVSTVMDQEILRKERIFWDQQKDPFCRSQNSGAYSSKSEFFRDKYGVMYRRQANDKPQLVVSKVSVDTVIKLNHDPVYIAHPGMKRTFELIALGYWWPSMRKSMGDHVRKCDACQRRNADKEFVSSLEGVEEQTAPFQVTSMDITSPGFTIPREYKYLLTLIDHFSKWTECFPIPDQTAEICARVYATQVITCHGTGSTLITDQGRSFVSTFFKETCRILKIRKVQTSTFHPQSNAMIVQLHR
jgi:hypothetical protein